MPSFLRRLPTVLAAAALLALGLQAAPAVLAPPTAAAADSFIDDFNGPAGAAADASKWTYETGDNNGNNHERQWYTAGAANGALDGQGHLVITAKRENSGHTCWYGACQYTSARLNTAGKFSQAYGHVETRMKIPRDQGMWPAFWMLGGGNWPNDGEIDIMENIGREPNTVHGTIHGPGYSGAGGIGSAYNGPVFANDFHTYAVDWSPNKIVWSVDGNAYETRTPADLNGNRWVFDHPFYLILNLAVGGDWPGDPDGGTQFPQQLVVDYVHVTTSGTGGSTGRIIGIGGKCVDVPWANPANFTQLQITDCNGNAAQNWTIGSDGTIRALGKCMDVKYSGTDDGTPVQMYDCNNSDAQQWVVTAARDIVNPHANKCLDAAGVSSANGTKLQLWTCTGNVNQKWSVNQ